MHRAPTHLVHPGDLCARRGECKSGISATNAGPRCMHPCKYSAIVCIEPSPSVPLQKSCMSSGRSAGTLLAAMSSNTITTVDGQFENIASTSRWS